MRPVLIGALALLLSFTVAVPSADAERVRHSLGKWSSEVLDDFGSLPVQDGGRIKPLDTYASFKLLRLNGKRTYTTAAGERISPLEWLLDVLYYPEKAKDYEHFLVDNSEIITIIGGQAKQQRDRYSYNEIFPARMKLFQMAQQYAPMDQKDLDNTQRQILNLASNVHEFEMLIHYFDFARETFPLGESILLRRIYDGKDSISLSEMLSKSDDLQKAIQAIFVLQEQDATPEERDRFRNEEQRLVEFFNYVEHGSLMSQELALIPPADRERKEWYSPSELLGEAIASTEPLEKEIAHLAALENTVRNVDNKIVFRDDAKTLRNTAVSAAKLRGEYSKVPIERQFYAANFFFWAQWLFVLSFILVAFSWMFTQSTMLYKLIAATILAPWTLLVVGITYRCIIRSRPPITTLYETILFITAAIVITALIMEYINRQRIALAVASFMGSFGLFLAYKYEMNDKQDTMPSLVAVLDTNFWLSTHVTIVTTGYAAGLLAGGLGCLYIFSKLFNFKKDDKGYYKAISRMIYGSICFGLVFAFIGTVLGGIWANYSWGRFWGWDPKENGALLIVLSMIAMLHARMGGYIRDLGMAMSSVFCGMVVAFSWWGVNLLGVGLHSYGFTSGIWGALSLFWLTQVIVLLAGVTVFVRDRLMKHVEKQPPRSREDLSTAEPVAK